MVSHRETLWSEQSFSSSFAQKQIANTKKGTMKMQEYLLKMKGIADSLAVAGSPVSVDDLISNCLLGLDVEYLAITSILQRQTDLSWHEFKSDLLNFECTLDQYNVGHGLNSLSLHESSPTVHAAEVKQETNRSGGQSSNVNFQISSNNNGGPGNRNGNRGRGGRNRGRGGFRSSTNNKPTCQICGKFGHSAAVCYFRADMKYMGSQQNMPSPIQPQMRFTPSVSQQQNSFLGTTSTCPDSSWYMDSGASSHITSDPSQLGNCTPYGGNASLMVGNGTYLPITNTGSAFIPSTGSKLSFHNTLCVPSIRKNLLSVSQLTRDNNVLIEFRRNTCLVKDIPTNEVLLHGSLHNGLYRLVGPPVHSPGTPSAFLASNKGLSSLWHSRLGHPAHRVLCQILNNHLRLPVNSVHNFCSHCPLGKIHALPFAISHHISSNVLDLIHTDVWGPSPVTSIGGFNYYIHFMDDCTRFTWLYPLRLKSDAVKAFIHFKTMVEN
ncbi:hypothetical protein Sjap_004227 [Stephania japonica]|uniref:GAG-pre-integrase domain-containing protein n=1 Tax=Stephania japonica TaxID=461633 RepID=A0AAP0PIW1_9MAGN